jgi:ABC-type branched-subunit amino acid transport system substrate-binding protein
MCVINALQATKGDTSPEKLRQALLAVSFDGPFGHVTFDQKTGVRHVDMHISKVIKQGKEYLWQPIFTYKDVPALGY